MRSPFNDTGIRDRALDMLKSSLPVLVGAFVLFRPIPHVTALEEISFYSLVAVALILIFSKNMTFSFEGPLTVPFALFTVWAVMGLSFAVNKPNSVHDVYAHLLKYLAFFYIVINTFNTKKRFLILTWIIILSAAIFSFGGMIYVYGIQGHPFSERFVNPTYYPYREFVYLFATLLALNKILEETDLFQRLISLFCLVGTIGAIFLTRNRGALIALAVSLLILFLKRRRDWVGLIALILIPLLLLSPFASRLRNISDHKSIRTGIQRLYVEVIKDHPVMGIGFGMQTYTDKRLELDKYNSRVPEKYRHRPSIASPHNSYLDIAARVGIVGFLLFFWIIVTCFKMSFTLSRFGKDDYIKAWGYCLLTAFIAFCIQAIFHETSYGVQVIVQYLIFAMVTILWRLNRQGESPLPVVTYQR